MKILVRIFWGIVIFTCNNGNAKDSNSNQGVIALKDYKIKVETLAQQSDVIWGFDFVSDDQILFTERGGKLKLLNLKTKKVEIVSGAPKVWATGQGGLLDVAVNPSNKTQIFLSYSIKKDKDNGTTAIGTGILKDGRLEQFKQIFEAHEANDNKIHFGSRFAFDGKGHMFFSVGDRNDRDKAQSLKHHNGKILRLKTDGTSPSDNPFAKNKDALPEIWSLGHRNPQGLAFDSASGKLWQTEFGPRGGDELNLIRPGENFGWPKVTYGKEYWGPSIGVKEQTGFVSPIAYWVPSISPSGLAIYDGKLFPKWKGNIFLANLGSTHIRRLKIENDKVTEQEQMLTDLDYRFRQIRVGREGEIYFSTDYGILGKIIPATN
jgi:glucose/arabinose dehydrogenase